MTVNSTAIRITVAKRPSQEAPCRRGAVLAALLASASSLALLLQMGVAQAQATIDGGSTVTVPGTQSSPWNVGGNLVVGNTGIGTLTISSGGSVSSGVSYLGLGPGSSGTVTLTGPGATWTASDLRVGSGGSGSLMIGNGGSVSNNIGYVGFDGVSSGTVAVTGAGSTWSNGDGLYIGSNGTGSLAISSGGTVSSILGVIGNHTGSSGTVTVTGPGSTWSNSNDLFVGGRGTASLTIEDGGAVSNFDGRIGNQTGSSGTVVVRGAGSQWSNSGELHVGATGTGALTIADGGAVSAATTRLGEFASGQATLTLNGTAGARGSLTTGQILKGAGSARLTLDGGILRATADQSDFLSNFAPGDVVVNASGAFIDSNGHSIGIDTTLSGTGGLTKQGDGTLTLAGANTYSGGTTVSGGTLEIQNRDALGTSLVRLAGGHLRSNISGTATLPNEIRFEPNQTSTLSAAAGQTLTIDFWGSRNGSTIRFGTPTDTGTIIAAGPSAGYSSHALEVNGGTLRAGSDQLSYHLIGAHTVTIARDATLDLATYDTRINNLQGDGTLISNGPRLRIFRGTFGGTLAGSAPLIKPWTGTLTLTGTSTLTGPTTVEDGALVVNGSLATSPVTVAGGTLAGTGTVGGIVAQSGGTVGPGNSIGTLNVTGNVSFAPGSFYALEINGAGQSDRIAASGAATLNGGTVRILPDQGIHFVADSPYTILTAQGGVSGRFAGTAGGEFAFITPTLRYSPDAVTLTMVRKTEPPPEPPTPEPPTPPTPPEPPQPVAFHTVAQTRNQYTTADGVEALGAGNRLYDTVLGASVAGARQAFDALSGEAHASAATVTYEDGRLVREAILTRLRQPVSSTLPSFARGSYSAAYAADGPGAAPPIAVTPSFDPRRFALWGEGFGSWGQIDGNGNAAGLDTSTGGFILGADALVADSVRIGVAGGFTRTTFDVDGRLSSGSNDSVFGALYGSGSWGALSLRLGAAYAWHDFDVSRTIRFPGLADSTHASYDGWTAQAFAELGYRVDVGSVRLEPFVGASVLRLHTEAFQEDGGAAALTGFAQDQDLATTTLGLRAETRLSDAVPLTLRGLLGWRHAYGAVEPKALLAFAGGASAFTVAGVPIDRDALVAEAGLDWQASEALSLGVSYSGQIGSRAQDHALKGNLVWRFSTR